MNPDVIPILAPQVDWQTLVTYHTNFTGTNVVKNVSNLDKPESFIRFLGLIEGGAFDTRYWETMTYGFMIHTTNQSEIEILRMGGKTFGDLGANRPIIWVENLKNWQHIMLSGTVNLETQIILNKIFLHFEQIGLRNLWAGYKKSPIGDKGRFYLEAK